jgi:hypothetical protein
METLRHEGDPKRGCRAQVDIKPGSKPVKQRLRRFNNEKCMAIGEEVMKLLSAGFIREVFQPSG